MSWEKTILSQGNGVDMPAIGAKVKIDYTGWLRDPNSADNEKGKQFDSSKGRGPLATPIGKGRVIKGWDEGVLSMTLGEEAILTIDSSYAYGDKGFPGVIPPKSDLVFQVKLLEINGKRAS